MRRFFSQSLGPLAVICLLVAGVFGRLLIKPASLLVDPDRPSIDEHMPESERSVGNDLTRLFLPHHQRISQAVKDTGRVPFWDPAGFGGRPLVGNPQGGLWYPPVWLAWVWFTPSALGWLTVAHLAVAGAGALTLARIQGLGRFAALVAGCAFAISPQLMGHTYEGHYPHVWAVAWYPWVFTAMLLWHRKGARWAWTVVPPLSLCLLSGHPQEGFFLLLALGVWVLAMARQRLRVGQPRGALMRLLLAWCAIVAIVLGLTCLDWLPALALKDWLLNRADLSLKDASRYHVGLLNFLQLLNPRALGGPADYAGPDNYWETQLAFGWTVLLLGLIATFSKPQNRQARGWAILAIVSLLFAMGRNLGVFPLFYTLVPGMDRFRVPARSLFLTSLAVTQLAAHGVELLQKADHSTWLRLSRRYARLTGGLMVLVILGACFSIWSGPVIITDSGGPRLLRALRVLASEPVFWLSALGAGLLLGWSRLGRFSPRAAVLGLGSLAILELASEGFLLVQVAPASRFLAGDQVAAALHRHASDWPPRVRSRDRFYGDAQAIAAGVEKTNLNDYFQLQHAATLYEELYPLFDGQNSRPRPGRGQAFGPGLSGPRARQAVLDRMGVEFVVTDRPLSPSEATGLRLVEAVSWQGQATLIYQNPTAMPWAYVVPEARVLTETNDGLLLRSLIEVPAHRAVLMNQQSLPSAGPRQSFTPASYIRPRPDRVVAQVTTMAPGLLVVADTWMPGWKASLDGDPVPVLQGNACQRVIRLEKPGRHRVEMWYEPPGLALASVGCGLSIAMLAAWSGSCLLLRWKFSPVQIQPLRLRSHHSSDSKATKIRKNGQLSQRRTSF